MVALDEFERGNMDVKESSILGWSIVGSDKVIVVNQHWDDAISNRPRGRCAIDHNTAAGSQRLDRGPLFQAITQLAGRG